MTSSAELAPTPTGTVVPSVPGLDSWVSLDPFLYRTRVVYVNPVFVGSRSATDHVSEAPLLASSAWWVSRRSWLSSA